MRKITTLLLFLCLSFVLFGCTTSVEQNQGGYLTEKQVVKMDPKADWLKFKGKVYKSNIDWSDMGKFTKGSKLGEVSRGMASHIPIGAEIYESKERSDILIVDYMKVEKHYLLQRGE